MRVLILAVIWFLISTVLGILGRRIGSPSWLLWPSTIGAAVTSLLACTLAVRTARGPARDFWRRLVWACGWLTVATAGQAYDTLSSGLPVAMSRLTAAGYLIAVGSAVLALVRLPRPSRAWRASVAMFLDVAIVGVAASMGVTHFLWNTSIPAANGQPAAALIGIVLFVACAAVVAVVKVGIARSRAVNRAALWTLAPIGLIAPLAWTVAPLFEGRPYLNPTVVTLPTCAVFFAAAALMQIRADSGPPAPPAEVDQPGHLGIWRHISVVPYTAVAVTVTMLVVLTLRHGQLSAGMAGGSVVLTLLVMIRQYAALSDNNLLLDRLDAQANHDDLTGLPNRRFFTAALAARTGTTTVAVCDLDGFAALNDRLGDEAGDALLRAAAERVRTAAGPDAVAARLLGDEFGILLPRQTSEVAESILQAFRSPLRVDGHDLLVTVTVGYASGSRAEVPDLLRRAELALQAAKLTGANRSREHCTELDATAEHHAELAAALRRGLDRGEFRLLYQPIVELPAGTIVGVEALVRWHPSDGPVVSPVEFIPVAEHSGLIIDLGAWIINQACADAAGWQDRHGDAGPRVNINVSARQLLDPDLPGLVADALSRHGLAPERITIEITETAVFAGGVALSTVRELRELGVGIALDDFGTGHSSLTLLRTCPVTTLKVDKSFIDDLNGTAEQEAIATSLSTIAATLGLRAVAEGVETREQADRLVELGYRYAQGYYFARPAPAADIDAALTAPALVA
ncbi:diguanylate cyclase (GGDEF)-like protein [Actinoplanes lutulentus]|uniref:Diguanylate cyclase (GGDEF)-like protein n=1 Tax=Actinoplanes lutulentus TaxID=1287878 RepID=A0A327YZV3_9ACTN|nr:bifunctional diguanylate cyclase/phosphodiesterase [Actinoplanes lutulentus]MBB2943163.1 diguanylate cyclase (GGDEF)-like protein [Actinoplanes lutulentus]RAK25542.1 diguanylate cyclase (GGDEF)-like protein [Actinoplanes lutulentus]